MSFPSNELQWAQMMLLVFEKWDDMLEYEDVSAQINGIEEIMNQEPTSLKDALNVIRKKNLEIEKLKNEVDELKNEAGIQ